MCRKKEKNNSIYQPESQILRPIDASNQNKLCAYFATQKIGEKTQNQKVTEIDIIVRIYCTVLQHLIDIQPNEIYCFNVSILCRYTSEFASDLYSMMDCSVPAYAK